MYIAVNSVPVRAAMWRSELGDILRYFFSLLTHECYFVLHVNLQKAIYNTCSEHTVDKIAFMNFFTCPFLLNISSVIFGAQTSLSNIDSAIFIYIWFLSSSSIGEKRSKTARGWVESMHCLHWKICMFVSDFALISLFAFAIYFYNNNYYLPMWIVNILIELKQLTLHMY